jgi:hypothetical protein
MGSRGDIEDNLAQMFISAVEKATRLMESTKQPRPGRRTFIANMPQHDAKLNPCHILIMQKLFHQKY